MKLPNALSKFHPDMTIAVELGDNCIQNLHLRRYIVRYAVGNLVLGGFFLLVFFVLGYRNT